jgi:hypothetical protein
VERPKHLKNVVYLFCRDDDDNDGDDNINQDSWVFPGGTVRNTSIQLTNIDDQSNDDRRAENGDLSNRRDNTVSPHSDSRLNSFLVFCSTGLKFFTTYSCSAKQNQCVYHGVGQGQLSHSFWMEVSI